MNYTFVTTRSQFDDMLSAMKNEQYIVFDTETNTLNIHNDKNPLIGISFWLPSIGAGYYLSFRHGYKPDASEPDKIVKGTNLPLSWLKEFPMDTGAVWIGYNTLFDLAVFDAEGLALPDTIEDVWTAFFLLDENEALVNSTGRKGAYGLKRLARVFLGDATEGEELLFSELDKLGVTSNKKGEMWRLSGEQTAMYAIDDVRLTWELREFCRPNLERWGQWALYLERNEYYRKVVFLMEKTGILVDRTVLEELSAAARQEAFDLLKWLVEFSRRKVHPEVKVSLLPFNPRSNTQVKELLGSQDARQDTIKAMADEGYQEAKMLLEYKEHIANMALDKAWDIRLELSYMAVDRGIIGPFTLRDIEEEVLRAAFNPSSPSQLMTLFMEHGVTLHSTEKATLELLEAQGNELAGKVLYYRTVSKAESTYYGVWRKAMDKDGYLHSTIRNQTVTGRPNSFDPNMNTMPRKGGYPVKQALIAPPGYVVMEVDYKSQELFVAAAMSGCESMGRLVSEGQDLHWYTTENMNIRGILYPGQTDEKILHQMGFKRDEIDAMSEQDRADKVKKGLRHVGKTLNFAIMYGAGAKSLINLLNVSKEEAYKLIEAWYNVYPEIDTLSKELQEDAQTGRYPDGSPGGPFLYHRNPDGLVRHFNAYFKAGMEPPFYVCLNVLVQGHSAAITRRALLRLAETFPEDDDRLIIVLNLYDAVYAYVREDAIQEVMPVVEHIMTDFDMSPRLQVEGTVGKNWKDKVDWKEYGRISK